MSSSSFLSGGFSYAFSRGETTTPSQTEISVAMPEKSPKIVLNRGLRPKNDQRTTFLKKNTLIEKT
jgi:hypothetical protein